EHHLVGGHGIEVYVFADSDGRVSREWLRRLIEGLDEEGVGATTGFRWYRVGESFWSLLRSLWNALSLTAFGPHRRNFAWGGSRAIRRRVAEAIGLREAWQGAVSDDYTLTEAVRASGYWIKFVPSCLVVSSGTCSFRELIEFTNRQIAITRVYAPRLWWMVLLTHLLFTVVFLSGVWGVVERVVRGGSLSWPLMAVALIYLPGVIKGVIRERAVGLMRPELVEELRRFRWAYWLLHPLVSLLYVVNGVASAVRREITWRGIRYRLVSRRRTEVIGGWEEGGRAQGGEAAAGSTLAGLG
ncbi:MAG TPA: glycosyltransferase family 2 protein, partial [Blastocatellia bacterium]|nr:glycosyltransferase family 2 protein [Blastocatellia bacterium]